MDLAHKRTAQEEVWGRTHEGPRGSEAQRREGQRRLVSQEHAPRETSSSKSAYVFFSLTALSRQTLESRYTLRRMKDVCMQKWNILSSPPTVS